MHEVSLVADLVRACERRGAGQPVARVRVRHASSLPEEALRQAFSMLTIGGPLERTILETEEFPVELDCSCGFSGVLGHDDIISSSMVVCPACGSISTRERTAEIELLEVS
jgi:Zn finger protein HypA/HybF involved in hydrogenase expression